MKLFFPLVLFFLLPFFLLADFRINLIAPGGLAFAELDEGLTGMQGGWLKEKKDTYLTVSGPLSPERKKWRFSIVPKHDGFLTIQLVAEGKENGKEIRAAYSDIRLEGADLRNGTLAELSSGRPAGWSAVRKAEFHQKTEKSELLCDRLNYWTQRIRVEKGRTLHVQITVRKDLP